MRHNFVISLNKVQLAYKTLGVKKIRGKYFIKNGGRIEGACPLYAVAIMLSKQKNHDKIMKWMDNYLTKSYCLGFTMALDGLEYEPEINKSHYTKGYEEGEFIREKLFP